LIDVRTAAKKLLGWFGCSFENNNYSLKVWIAKQANKFSFCGCEQVSLF
jgi:hypothetical protein